MKHCGVNKEDLNMTRDEFEQHLSGYSDEMLKYMMMNPKISDCGVCVKCGAKLDGYCNCVECPICGYRSCDAE